VAQCITDSQRLLLICPKWTGPDQARTSLPEFWTGPILVQKLLGLDLDQTGLDQSGLVHTRTTGIIGHRISIVNGHSLSAGNLIPSRRTNDYSLMPQWISPREMRCRQHQNIMTSRDFQCHIRNKSIPNNRDIRTQSTEWTYTNEPLFRPHRLGLGRVGLMIHMS